MLKNQTSVLENPTNEIGNPMTNIILEKREKSQGVLLIKTINRNTGDVTCHDNTTIIDMPTIWKNGPKEQIP